VNTRQETAGQEAVSMLEEKERNRTRVAIMRDDVPSLNDSD